MAAKLDRLNCVMAGGGTGGHLFPALAVASQLKERVRDCRILFVIGKRGRGEEILKGQGHQVIRLNIEGFKGRSISKALMVMAMLPKSVLDSVKILRGHGAQLVFGVGGYTAGPVCVAARLLGVKVAIHEQNTYPGLTNRLLSRISERVFISFEESRRFLRGAQVVLTGTPIRREILTHKRRVGSAEQPRASEKRPFTLLVLGGSQGARAINTAVVDALAILGKRGNLPDLARQAGAIRVIHQTGELDHGRVKRNYAARLSQEDGLEFHLIPFIEDMAWAYGEADLVVSRAGASTLFELAALGKPSILIPYPYATNNHQELNARALEGMGGAVVIPQAELSGERLARAIAQFMEEPERLEKMGQNAKGLSKADAAALISEQLLEMVVT